MRDENDLLLDGDLPGEPEDDAVPMVATHSDAAPLSMPDPMPLGGQGGALASMFALAQKRHEKRERPVPTPFGEYSAALAGGFWPGTHVLVGGTGSGKTSLALDIAYAAAAKQHPVAFVALELDAEQIAARLLVKAARAAGHKPPPWSDLYYGQAVDPWRAPGEVSRELGALPLHLEIGSAGRWEPRRMVELARWLRARPETESGAVPLLVVDFLQVIGADPTARSSDPVERIGALAYHAAEVSKQYGVAVLLLSSTARSNYTQDDGGVVLFGANGPERYLAAPDALVGMGKWSGDIEYSATTVNVLVRWPATAQPKDGNGTLFALAVAKGRAVPPTWLPLWFKSGEFSVSQTHLTGLPAIPKGRGQGKKNGTEESVTPDGPRTPLR